MSDKNRKEMNDLMDSMFRNHRLNTVSAKEYLQRCSGDRQETEKKITQTVQDQVEAVDTMKSMDEAMENLNSILNRQTEQIKAQSRELGFTDEDFEKLQKEVEKDFGIQVNVDVQKKRQDRDLKKTLEEMHQCIAECEKTVLGQHDYLAALSRAFYRPFVEGAGAESLRNVFVISGPAGSGRHLSLKTILKVMKDQQRLGSDAVTVLNGNHYTGSEQEKIFIQDCYSASCSQAEVIVVENTEAFYPPFLNQLMTLCEDRELTLSQRYGLNKNKQLVEVGNTLMKKTVSTLRWKDKYVVFLCTSAKKCMQNFPNSLAGRILDQPTTQRLSQQVLSAIYHKELDECIQHCKADMGLQVIVPEGIVEQRMAQLETETGAHAVHKEVEQLKDALTELCLKSTEPVSEVTLKTEGEWSFLIGRKEVKISELIHIEEDDLTQIRKEMEEIVGLDEVKSIVHSMEEHFKVMQLRQKQGMKAAPVSRHMIFTGNPGTGKTTMARLIARLFKAVGLLSQGQLIEVSRADLVGRYVGHTAPLTQKMIESALGGILFIDEAYSLVRGKDDSFGLEAVDTLVKGMEDHRDDLIVILAGYSKEMEEFLQSNSGLRSRFPNILNFEDYTGSELTRIAVSIAKGKQYKIDESCLNDLTIYFNTIQMQSAERSGNGRLARNVVEKAILKQSGRILKQPESALDLLIREDFDLETE